MRAFLTLFSLFPAVFGAEIKPSTLTVPGPFPTSLFSKYHNTPTVTFAQVQPVISDPVTHEIYPFSLTDPDSVPNNNTVDPHPLPPTASPSRLVENAFAQILSIAANPVFGDNRCARCIAGFEAAKFLALAAPKQGPALAVRLCDHFKFSSTCSTTFGPLGTGGVITQVVANADVGGLDGQYLCQNFLNLCPLPAPPPLNLTAWFKKPKPNPLPPPKKPSGKRLKVLHLSDMHLDARYSTGAEANCTSGLCCRKGGFNSQSPNVTLLPAPRFGADTPLSLIVAALEAIPPLTETQGTGFAWTVYTGDLVAHDADNQLSREYVTYVETLLYDLLKKTLGPDPVYATLGNHDSYNQAQDAPHAIGQGLAGQFSWNYDHLALLWKHEKWLPDSAVRLARTHYAGYMVKRADNLRVISLNTDMWYRANYFNYINMTDHDVSGMLRFLTDELQDAEDHGERVWIIGHVLSGWDGTNPLIPATDLFYQIVDRFSPHVIANVFFGHTHEDQMSIFYRNNATVMNSDTAQALAWMGPSLTPGTNMNSGFRVYEVDSATFEVLDAHTWRSDVSTFPGLDSQIELGPTYTYEYNTRETYGKTIQDWGANDPLNATWWHRVTEAMEADNSLVATFNILQGKSSIQTRPCTGDCIDAKICYIRSGSAPIGRRCPQGFGSVQS
ncbi:Metallo-dependent phosphatase [Pleurotus eryngii]|uniref:Metallo-dependent phosphatase n=1 Tax=Pleurotus eryngii TaxID=5323 RepID=A0A9P6DLD7_PLEER|nr:Metallo-dependent phosphatase [Pleurotus eryngii]